MSDDGLLDRLASLADIEPGYHDISGTWHAPTAETKRALLRAMGLQVETEAEIARSVSLFDELPWRQALEPVEVVTAGSGAAVISMRSRTDRADRPLGWRIAMETGATISGSVRPCDLPLVETRRIDGLDVERRQMTIPGSVTPGYHRIEVDGDGLGDLSGCQSTLVVAPTKAFLSERLTQGAGAWGFAVQAYALQGRDSWGMGDFSDLAGLAATSATLGAGVLGTNPLHALFPVDPSRASPYSPSSRSFLNTLYIDVTSVPDFADCPELQSTGTRDLDDLRKTRLVAYNGVAALKLSAFERLYRSFQTKHLIPGTARANDFHAFRREAGTDLERFAIFSALDEYFREGTPSKPFASLWPSPYRDPDSPEVAKFVRAHFDRVLFFQYLQWLADQQLARVATACRRGGMSLGLYRDLAVGVDPEGADVWANPTAYAVGISTGAPPDPFNLKGQSWGLPPLRPAELRSAAYRPFIAALRANMRYAGALRIDHIMSLTRLFWIPKSEDARNGGYVRYPLEDLIAITALESQRARCVVIGEDLGTVPAGLRERLAAANILSTRLLYFEHDGTKLRPSAAYPRLAQVSIRTQDLPTFSGYWNECDIAISKTLHLLSSPEKETQMRHERSEMRQSMIALLHADAPKSPLGDDVSAIAAELYRFLAESPSLVVMVYLEDLLGIDDQTNFPGTVEEYPNWQIKLSADWRDAVNEPRILTLARKLAVLRPS
jgi:4-alpha-glucanotransferase